MNVTKIGTYSTQTVRVVEEWSGLTPGVRLELEGPGGNRDRSILTSSQLPQRFNSAERLTGQSQYLSDSADQSLRTDLAGGL